MDIIKIRESLNMGISLYNIPLRVAIYTRVSTNHEEQKTSLLNQEDYFNELINNNSNWHYIKKYEDSGKSGTTDYHRTSFMQMINDAFKDQFDLILTKEISRFSRNTLDSIKYTRELLNHGVGVLFVVDNINTFLPDSELRLSIMSSMAQDEIRRLSERVKFGMKRAQKNNITLGNNQLYGYQKNFLTNTFQIIEHEANIIRKIYELYAIDNISLNKIVNYLNDKKILTNNNKKWSTTRILRIIDNPKYKGFYCGHKVERIDYITKKTIFIPKEKWIITEDHNQYPPIISEELWNKANQKIHKHVYSQNKKSIYSSKIYCQNDNLSFYRRQIKNSKEYTWYCQNYLKNGKNHCNTQSLREEELDIIFLTLFNNIDIDIKKITNNLINIYKKNNQGNMEIDVFSLNKKNIIKKIIPILLKKIIVKSETNNIYLQIYLNSNIQNHTTISPIIFFRNETTNHRPTIKIKYFIKCYY